jgi:hypothetical protein
MSTTATPRIDWPALRETLDLAEIATRLLGPAPGRRGERSSRKLWWLCPFHEDRNASLCVPIGSSWWRCFACDSKGDATATDPRFTRARPPSDPAAPW